MLRKAGLLPPLLPCRSDKIMACRIAARGFFAAGASRRLASDNSRPAGADPGTAGSPAPSRNVVVIKSRPTPAPALRYACTASVLRSPPACQPRQSSQSTIPWQIHLPASRSGEIRYVEGGPALQRRCLRPGFYQQVRALARNPRFRRPPVSRTSTTRGYDPDWRPRRNNRTGPGRAQCRNSCPCRPSFRPGASRRGQLPSRVGRGPFHKCLQGVKIARRNLERCVYVD